MTDPRTPLSPHFALSEFVVSRTAAVNGIDNTPPDWAVANLTRLCTTILEPARVRLGAPIITTSGFRCPQLNALDGGVPDSYHTLGLADDGHSPRFSNYELMKFWVEGPGRDLPWDKVIFEYGGWVHAQAAKDGEEPRKQAYMIFKLPDGESTGYIPWDPTKVDPATGLYLGG